MTPPRLLVCTLATAVVAVGCPYCGPMCGGAPAKVLTLCVEHVSVAPDLDGQPWQPDGAAPRVLATLGCPAATNPVTWGTMQQGWDVHLPTNMPSCCQYTTQEALLADHVTLQLANVHDAMTWDVVMPKTTVRIQEADLAAGSKHVGTVEGAQEMDLSLESDSNGWITVKLTHLALSSDNAGTPWDRDGSPPDMELLWDSGQQIPLGEGFDLRPAASVGQWERSALLQDGVRFALLDNDTQDWIVAPMPVNYSSTDVAGGEHVFAPLQHALEVRLVSMWQDLVYGCI